MGGLGGGGCHPVDAGWPRFGSVRLRFGCGTVRAVPVFGFGGSSGEGFPALQYRLSERDGSGFGSWNTVLAVPVPVSVPAWKTVLAVLVPVSVPENLKRFRRFRFPVPVRFLDHPVDVSHLSRGNVLFLPRTLCPTYVEF